MAENQMEADVRKANEETRQAWNRNVAFWDERMGEGNNSVEVLLWPAIERVLGLCAARTGAGRRVRERADLPAPGCPGGRSGGV